MSVYLIDAFVKMMIAKNDWEPNDAFLGSFAEIFITQKHNLIFQCSLCYSSLYRSFPELLNHIVQQHNIKVSSKIEQQNLSSFQEAHTASSCQIQNPDKIGYITLEDDKEDYGEVEFLDEHTLSEEWETEAETIKKRSWEWYEAAHAQIIVEGNLQEDNEDIVKQMETVYDKTSVEGTLWKAAMEVHDTSKCPISGKANLQKKEIVEVHTVGKFKVIPRKKKFRCDLCGRMLATKYCLLIHSKSHQEATCDKCGLIFKNKVTLNNHLRVHSERKWKCKICDAMFKFGYWLRDHMKTHVGIKEFACSQCPRRFYRKGQLMTHKKCHIPKHLPLICDKCGNRFRTNLDLEVHLLNQHIRNGPLECRICNKTFVGKSDIMKHLDTHAKDQKVACDVCNLKLKNCKSLNEHMKIHENKRGYVCKICYKDFNQLATLSSHLKSVHTGLN